MRFAADENFNGKVLDHLRLRLPDMDIVRVQDTVMYQSSDPDVLAWAANEGRILLTHDVQTLVNDAYNRVKVGLPMPGGIRDQRRFWREWREYFPETLSPSNVELIKGKLGQLPASPIVDEQWIRYFPEHDAYIHQKLIHHHVHEGRFAIPVPMMTHQRVSIVDPNIGIPGDKVWHAGLSEVSTLMRSYNMRQR